jgi:hypothetical protein
MTSPVRAPRPTPRRSPVEITPPRSDRRRDHLRVVSEPTRPRRDRRSGLRAPVLLVAAVLVFGSLLTSAVFHGLLVGGQSHLDQMESQLDAEKVALAREKLALAQLSSPDHIASQAAALGMVVADEQIWLSPGSGGAPVIAGGPGPGIPAGSHVDATSELASAPVGAEVP